MEGQTRETLGERLANRLSSRAARRPRMALDASFYARFGLEDPWGAPEMGESAGESGDGMVFLSGAPFYAMMRRLALSRRRRERRQARFFERRAGTTMRAATRRWAGEGEALAPQFRIARATIDAFILPPPVGTAPDAAPAEGGVVAERSRAPNPPMRKSPWHTTPFVPARVVRGSQGIAAAAPLRPLARVGERLQAVGSENEQVITVAGQLPARVRRAIATVVQDVFPPEMPIVEVVRVLRRVGAPASVIREVIEVVPAAAAVSVAARRMPVGVPVGKPAGLRTVMARSPAMALAASADADHAAAGTLGTAQRSESRTGSERPLRAAVSRASARSLARGAQPLASAPLSASPVSRVSAGRPAALRAQSVSAVAASAAAERPAPARITRRVGQTFLPALRATSADELVSPSLPGSAHAVSRVEGSAPVAPRLSRTDGAAWAHVRAFVGEPGADESVLPSPIAALRRPVRTAPATSGMRPVVGTGGRIVTARVAAATAAAAPVLGTPAVGPTAVAGVAAQRGPRATRLTRAVRPRPDAAAVSLAFPAKGASPVQQAFARLDGAEVAPASPAASVVPHATPRLDRPVRRAVVLDSGAFSEVTPVGAAEADAVPVARALARPGAGSRSAPISAPPVAAPRGVLSRSGVPAPESVASSAPLGITRRPSLRALRAAARLESPTRTAAARVNELRVSTSEVVRSAPPAAPAVGMASSGPMAWAPSTRFQVPSRLVGRRNAVSVPIETAAVPGSMPVREPSGRYVASRTPRTTERGVPRLVAVGAGRVDVVYVSPESLAVPAPVASHAEQAAPSRGPMGRPVRSLAWATSRSNVTQATAYRGAIVDGGLPAAARLVDPVVQPVSRHNRTAVGGAPTVVGGVAPLAADPQAPSASAPRPGARPSARPSAARSPVGRDRPARDAVAPARPGNLLSPSAFVAPTFGFDQPEEALASRPAVQDEDLAAPAQRVRAAGRPPLDRRLHDLATGGAPSGTEAPTWNARADGAPRVHSVHGLFESLAKATTAEQVVRVLFARADGLLATPSEVSAPIQQVISEIRQEVSRTPAPAASDEATLPTRPPKVAAPRAEPLRPQAGGSRPTSTTRVARGASRPVASRTRTIGAGSEDRIMKLVKKLQGLIHLAEAEHRLAEAQRQVRMAEDSHEARGEGGQGTRGGGQAGGNQDGSKMDIEQLGREVLDVVSRELEYRRERRMEDHDESIWW